MAVRDGWSGTGCWLMDGDLESKQRSAIFGQVL